MLAADKDRLIASAKQTALQLRHKELDYYIERYSNLATQASILAGFAFDGLVELEIPKDNNHPVWFDPIFYTAGSCTMAFALYTLCVASFAIVYGHRLALQGPTGSVERAVAVMMKSRTSIFVSFALSLTSLIVAAVAMAWVKMGDAAAVVSAIFAILFVLMVGAHQHMKAAFRIDPEQMVQGDVRLQVGMTDVDVATLEAGLGERSSQEGAGAAPADDDDGMGVVACGRSRGGGGGGKARQGGTREPLMYNTAASSSSSTR